MTNYVTSTHDIIGVGVMVSTIAEKIDYLDLHPGTPLQQRMATVDKALDAVNALYEHLTTVYKALESADKEGSE